MSFSPPKNVAEKRSNSVGKWRRDIEETMDRKCYCSFFIDCGSKEIKQGKGWLFKKISFRENLGRFLGFWNGNKCRDKKEMSLLRVLIINRLQRTLFEDTWRASMVTNPALLNQAVWFLGIKERILATWEHRWFKAMSPNYLFIKAWQPFHYRVRN